MFLSFMGIVGTMRATKSHGYWIPTYRTLEIVGFNEEQKVQYATKNMLDIYYKER